MVHILHNIEICKEQRPCEKSLTHCSVSQTTQKKIPVESLKLKSQVPQIIKVLKFTVFNTLF